MKLEVAADLKRASGFALQVAFSCESDALGIVGPSGSGKSTVLDVIAGVEPGRVLLDGRDWSQTPLHLRRVGYVMQEALCFPHLDVRRNLGYGPRAEGVEEVARALGIDHLLDRMPRNLSGGERRRVALGRAVASRPDLLLLDEPFIGLDEHRRREAMSLLHRLRRSFRIPMVLVSHVPEEVIGLTDWAVRLEEGRLVAAGPSMSILRAGETQIDNYFVARVAGPGLVRTGDVELVARLPDGMEGEVRLACYAHEILLATAPPAGISARNCFWTEITTTSPAAGAVIVGLREPPVQAVITPAAAEALDVRPGKRMIAIIKSTSLAFLGPA